MLDRPIEAAQIRTILNSEGGFSIEAEVRVEGGEGRGSVPGAIIPGRREQKTTDVSQLRASVESAGVGALIDLIRGARFDSQAEFDALFHENPIFAGVGTDVSLALSLAYCRAQAKASGQPLHVRIASLAGSTPAMPKPIVNVFSGGVHGGQTPFQQAMIIPKDTDFHSNVEIALSVYSSVQSDIKARGQLCGYSASSGMLTTLTDQRELFEVLARKLDAMGLSDQVGLGTDVAAEHLESNCGGYKLYANCLPVTLEELADYHRQLLRDYDFLFFEDPFGPDDSAQWRRLTAEVDAKTMIVGDDLFATNSANIDCGLASGILLKMNQVGTVSGTLKAAETARAAGMRLCVSHRSKETEDTAMCDLAVALGAELIKVGGPRRGDRIAKYNQLLRLVERLENRQAVPDGRLQPRHGRVVNREQGT